MLQDRYYSRSYSRRSLWLFSSVLLTFLIVTQTCQAQELPKIVQKAIAFVSHAENDVNNNEKTRILFEEIKKGDTHALYTVAKQWQQANHEDTWDLYHYLADTKSHVPSMHRLGLKYAEEGSTNIALNFFQRAGEEGPHHASLFNAGRILAEQQNWVGALAYLRAAVTLHQTYPKYAQESITNVAELAYDVVARQVAAQTEISIKESADAFVFGSLLDLPDDVTTLWTDAIMSLLQFHDALIATNGQDSDAMNQAVLSLRAIWETYSPILSPLQGHLVLHHMNTILAPLAGLEEEYVPMAAGYAEALASSQYCWEHYAVSEKDSACFNGAAASAMSYYRRIQDIESLHRVLAMANAHPHAATHWDSALQTPRVYHPEISSKPWWNANNFSAAMALSSLYENSKTQSQLLSELKAVKEALKTIEHREFASGTDDIATAQVDATGDPIRRDGGVVHTKETSEFGPLFDGVQWVEEHCQMVPTICRSLQEDTSLCTSRVASSRDDDTATTVWELCGTDTVVTILRLRPGASILSHCGSSNSRLTLHFPLEGSSGVEFTMGDQIVKDYGGGDGHAIVFDDSYEHSVYHGGSLDSFVIVAILAHPDLP